MMKKTDTAYAFLFVLGICVVCSLALAAVSEGLRPRKALNEEINIKENIFKAVDHGRSFKGFSPEKIKELFRQDFQELVVNAQGEAVAGMVPEAIPEGQPLYPVYIYRQGGQIRGYAFPVQGKGLWSTLYGYLALEADGETVRGITFYKHGETPGLGGEIEKEWFQNNFEGKKIRDAASGQYVPIIVVKGRVQDKVPGNEQFHYVDGISGATMTSRGVTHLLEQWLQTYEPYLKTIRSGGK